MGKPRKSSKAKLHPLNLTLAGLPELSLFPTDESRQKALESIAAEAGTPTRLSFWLGVMTLVIAVVGSAGLTNWLMRFVNWPHLIEEIFPLIGGGLGFLLTLRWLHRSGASGELREKLQAAGVPICLKCGYSLRGLPRESERCPECGVAVGAENLELLETNRIVG